MFQNMCYCRRGSYCCVTVGQYSIRHGPRSEEVRKWLWRETYVKMVTYILRPSKLCIILVGLCIYKQRAAESMKMVLTCYVHVHFLQRYTSGAT